MSLRPTSAAPAGPAGATAEAAAEAAAVPALPGLPAAARRPQAARAAPASLAPREGWIDAARGISIALVVAGHNPGLALTFPDAAGVLASFRMPLFFAIVGTTLAGRPTLRATLLRAAGLLISYVVLCLLTLALPMRRADHESLGQALLGILYGTGHTIAIPPLWFLPALALALLAAHAIDAVMARLQPRLTPATEACSALAAWLPGVLLLAALPALQPQERQDWGDLVSSGAWLNLDLALIGAGFIFVGRGLRGLILAGRPHEHRYPAVALGLVLLFALLYALLQPRLDLNMRVLQPGAGALLVATAGTAAALFIIYLLRGTLLARASAALGAMTLLVLWLHAGIEARAWPALAAWLPAPAALLASIAVALLVPYALDRWGVARLAWLRGLIYPQPWLRRRFGGARKATP